MLSQVARLVARGPLTVLVRTLVLVTGASLGACEIDDRLGAVETRNPNGPGQGGGLDASTGCSGAPCALDPNRCLPRCPQGDVCRSYVGVPAGAAPDAGCTTLADCSPSWKPAAREGDACRCDEEGCVLLPGEACSASRACDGASCVATADASSVCCAQTCAETETCAPDGSRCVPAEPCTSKAPRCSGSLHQRCVQGLWRTLTDCTLGCGNHLDGCLRSAGQACESDADCGEGACLATAAGNRVCCMGDCGGHCQRCSAQGTECEHVADDDACGTIECPTDPCRVYDPATVVTNRCRAGQCATPEQACAVFQPQRADQDCSAASLCDAAGNCSREKRELLAECASSEQCAGGACVATAGGTSVCCSEPCLASEVCGPTGACAPAPTCETGTAQCSGSNFQRCIAGQWVTDLACGALGCSEPREGCFAGAGQTCSSNADCGQGTCQEAAGGGSVCCTAVCDGPCRVCGASGNVCTNLQDDAACGAVTCPEDTTCRDFPTSVTALRCVAGACGTGPQLCPGDAQNVGQSCSASNLCDDAGNCSEPKRGNGEACGSGAQCASNNCVDGVCCNSACNGVCEACENGFCGAAATDTACGSVSCGSFDAACVTSRTNTVNACDGRGDCRTTADCGFRPTTTRCGQGGLCNGQGVCEGPSVECGTQTCSEGNVCCSMIDFETGDRTVRCGAGADDDACSFDDVGPGPVMRIECDQDTDCVGDAACCVVSTNVNSGDVTCREVCTAQAVGAELGAPPEMLVVGQLCASELGRVLPDCPGAQTCRAAVSTLPPDYLACR